MGDMKIGELAAGTGVSVRLLRYYEEQGLLCSQRTPGGQRVYDEGAADVVRNIRMLLDAGLPTKVIREVLPCVEPDGIHACVADRLRAQLSEIDGRITELSEARSSLAELLADSERVAPLFQVA